MEQNDLLTKVMKYFFVVLYFIGFLSNLRSGNTVFAVIWGVLFVVNTFLLIRATINSKKDQ